jgi:hypothetical protein
LTTGVGLGIARFEGFFAVKSAAFLTFAMPSSGPAALAATWLATVGAAFFGLAGGMAGSPLAEL